MASVVLAILYFCHVLNCVYDCRYCFLQAMHRSAHLVMFVNYEDFTETVSKDLTASSSDEQAWFFLGYDCESLAYEPVTGFVQ